MHAFKVFFQGTMRSLPQQIAITPTLAASCKRQKLWKTLATIHRYPAASSNHTGQQYPATMNQKPLGLMPESEEQVHGTPEVDSRAAVWLVSQR